MLQENINVSPVSVPAGCRTLYSESSSINKNGLDKIIRSATSLLHAEKKLALGYLKGFTEYFIAKSEGIKFVKPPPNAEYLDRAFIKAVKYV